LADRAFDAGVATIAAVGNTPGSNTAHSPANAHKAIGVGAFDVLHRITYSSQSRGPTRDGRIKPDIQAPHNTITASGWDDFGRWRFGPGTSGAAPYAASVAVLARAFLGKGTPFALAPGHVYAYLILSTVLPIGDPTVQIQPGPFKPPLVPEPVSWVNNKTGAGHLRMDTGGLSWFGSVSITDGAHIDIPLEMGVGGFRVLDAALWWPESPSAGTEVHNDIDLILVSPSGVQRAFSRQTLSVFERARVEEVGHLDHGTWRLRIHGFRVPGGSQTVFYAAHAGFG
jgi:serine protease AprX